MNSISVRTRREVRVEPLSHFKNYRSECVDGNVKLIESEPVVKAMAEDFSVSMNALRNQPSSPRSRRITSDAVDLADDIKTFKE